MTAQNGMGLGNVGGWACETGAREVGVVYGRDSGVKPVGGEEGKGG